MDVTEPLDNARSTAAAVEGLKARIRLTAGVFAGRLFQVNTPVVTSLSASFVEAVLAGDHGHMIVGRTRQGKTCGFRWTANNVRGLLGASVPVLAVPVRKESVTTDSTFFEHILTVARHRHAADGGGPEKRSRLVKWMSARARLTPLKMFVLGLDEANSLPPEALDWLLNTDNEMELNGFTLFIELIGTTDLLQMRQDCLERENGEKFVERFMPTHFEFHGLRSETELAAMLTAFHTTEYPKGSGTNFTSNYLEEEFDLADLAPAIWSKAAEIWSLHIKTKAPLEIPMAYATRTLVMLLDRIARERCPTRADAKMVEDALLRARFAQHALTRAATDLARAGRNRSTWGDRSRLTAK